MRDVGLATLIGGTAGLEALADPTDEPLEEKLDRALAAVLARLEADAQQLHQPQPADPAGRRLPGRPRKDGLPPGAGKPGGAA